ncbi:MAG: Hpt domain-containing protein [Bilophila wadsworthia]
MYVSLLFDFRRELAEADAEIRQARLRDDMPSIRASVHKLKGISGNVGATDLYTQLVELEQCLQGVPQKMSTTFLTPYTATLQRPRVSLRRQGRPSPRTPKPL